jgi:hypothetical protein
MRRGAIACTVIAALSALATLGGEQAVGAPAVDTYVTGKVLGRAPGTNLSTVEIAWAYKCLGDKLGDATYEWTLKVIRRSPLPRKTKTLLEGTSKRGSVRTRLGPGTYVPMGDPFRCETERGAGSDAPEVGALFVVPDYCAWTVTGAKGQVELEQGSAVKAARPGSAAAPGNAVTTSRGATAGLEALGGEGTAALAPSSRLEVQGGTCATKGGWALRLAQGSVTVSAAPRAAAGTDRRVTTSNATTSARASARWRVDVAGKTTTVRALAGAVTVSGRKGSPVVVSAGRSTRVVGSAAPSKP